MLLIDLLKGFYSAVGADYIVAIVGAVLGIGGAYFIYLISIRQLRKDRLTYVASLMESVISSARLQSEYCRLYRINILQKPFANSKMQKLADRDTRRLADKVDQEGVYHAYLWKYKRNKSSFKNFKNLYGIIDFLDFLIDDLLIVNEKILNNRWERKKQYQFTFSRAKESMQALFLIEEMEQEQTGLLAFVKKQLEALDATIKDDENLIPSYEIVVKPVKEYIITEAKRHDKITTLMFLLEDLDFQYNGIILSAHHIAEDYQYYAVNLNEKAEQLEQLSVQFRKDFKN